MAQTIKFSELRLGQFIAHGDDVITQKKALERHNEGTTEPMYTVTQEFIDSILHQIYDDYVKGIDKEKYTAPNDGMLIVFDEVVSR
ncbi:hypothetical protein EEL30_15520 [Brevibacillus laterosporus]|uniref:Uncharacterized protein n=1 Tax=Brevibacillus laterosporus TaxID=1465 RepID=A0A518V9A7_BRELA|nr:hypothetical protein EEL30_15520 [Brevibacillus laterosporus]